MNATKIVVIGALLGCGVAEAKVPPFVERSVAGVRVPGRRGSRSLIERSLGPGRSVEGKACFTDSCVCYRSKTVVLIIAFGTDDTIDGAQLMALSAPAAKTGWETCPPADRSMATGKGVGVGTTLETVLKAYGAPTIKVPLDDGERLLWTTDRYKTAGVALDYELRVDIRKGKVESLRVYDGP